MKVLIMGDRKRYEKYAPQPELSGSFEITYIPRDAASEIIRNAGADADILFADAISRVDGDAMRQMKNLKLIHSEGVAYNGIDTDTARELGIYVCNNKGANAGAVAEQAVYLMLALLRSGIAGDRAVREGRQIDLFSPPGRHHYRQLPPDAPEAVGERRPHRPGRTPRQYRKRTINALRQTQIFRPAAAALAEKTLAFVSGQPFC